ncbi:hypothetical protein PsorP6_004823 [Peronosclerospora sorghi]|uniref:Uncharacterized protein n=1 Tax=Peronosclerospora sorghi TaxID=230839 RepID=A0ACC0VQY1_9STRA|nr:hypothetical protein PsorP6_004823 [Peronosclerospora sorghi]
MDVITPLIGGDASATCTAGNTARYVLPCVHICAFAIRLQQDVESVNPSARHSQCPIHTSYIGSNSGFYSSALRISIASKDDDPMSWAWASLANLSSNAFIARALQIK